MKFVAIDLETANADMASICQIGAARFVDGKITEEWETYVDPKDYFDHINISIHGIDEEIVRGAPTFPHVSEELVRFLRDDIVVTHTHFDRVALRQAAARYKLNPLACNWLDSARVARRTWKQFAQRGYGLSNVCNFIGYEFKHHDALEDAKAAGHILLAAMSESGMDVSEWMQRVERPIDPEHSSIGSNVRRDGDTEGALFGKVLVFTGALEIPRSEAADFAASMGCRVVPKVTKKVTLLVVGDQDIQRLAGHTKSSKHRKAEELISKGQSIRILRESDFLGLAKLSD